LGHKTHPKGLRLGIVTGWSSRWYAEKDYAKFLHEDLKIQGFVKDKLMRAGVSSVEVERLADKRVHHRPYHRHLHPFLLLLSLPQPDCIPTSLSTSPPASAIPAFITGHWGIVWVIRGSFTNTNHLALTLKVAEDHAN
jgi:hypothetical protein